MPGTPKQFNTHKFPDATRQPRHLDRLRKEGAKEREEAYAKLTLQEKIDRLPAEPHAKKQRARLLSLLEKKKQPEQQFTAAVNEGLKDAEEGKTIPHEQVKRNLNKKYMKGAK
jgi:predicted transcriptional regulator